MRTAPRRSKLITPALLRRWPLPEADGVQGKEDRGCALIVGGSVPIPGAVILAATAALRAGAGMLQVATVRPVAPAVAINLPEARVLGLRADRQGELASTCTPGRARAWRERSVPSAFWRASCWRRSPVSWPV